MGDVIITSLLSKFNQCCRVFNANSIECHSGNFGSTENWKINDETRNSMRVTNRKIKHLKIPFLNFTSISKFVQIFEFLFFCSANFQNKSAHALQENTLFLPTTINIDEIIII